MINLSERNKGIIALLFLASLWGIAAILPRFLSISFKLYQQVYLRLFLGALFSFILFRTQIDLSKLKRISKKEFGLLISRSFIYYVLGVVIFTQALLLTKVSNVTFIGAIPMTALLGFILLKEKISIGKIFFVITSFVGVILISVQSSTTSFNLGLGEIFAFLSIFFVSLGMITRKYHTKLLNDKEIGSFMLLFGAIFVLIVSLLNGEGFPLTNWTINITVILILAGFINTGISYFVNYGLKRVDAVLSSNIMSLEPVFASIFALFIFSEVPMMKELIGGLLIIISVFVLHKLETKEIK